MRVSRMLGGGAVLATLAILPGLAAADVTAADIWADWQAQAQERDMVLTATLTATPGQIALSDIKGTTTTGEKVSTLHLSQITLVEEGGAVAIQLPDEQAVRTETTGSPHASAQDWRLRNPGLTMRASGDPQDITYRYAAPMVSLTLEQTTRDGVADPTVTVDAALTLTGAEGQQRSTIRNGTREIVSADRLSRVEANGSIAGTEGGMRMDGGIAIADLVTSSLIRNPTGTADPSRMLREAAVEVSLSHGALDASFNRNDEMRLTLHANGGRSETTIAEGRLANAGGLDAGEIAFSAAGLPSPPGLTFDALTTNVAMPLVQTDTAQPWALALSLDNFVGNAAAWELFDPGAVLPRDPGQLTLDASGRMRITADLAAPPAPAAEGEPPAPPFALETADINALTLSLAGARLTGTGQFTFHGEPQRPVGSADLILAGGERLLDGLVRIGLVPQGQAMMVRMMVGGFTRPGDAPDTLTSHLEFRADGSVLANGRPLR